MTLQAAEFPVREPLVGEDRLIADRWRIWFRNLILTINANATRLAEVSLTAQSASIGTTPFKTATLTAGQYRVSAFAHTTTAGSVSSSLTVTVSFTHKTNACTLAGPALTTNDITKPQSNVWIVSIDAGTPISYSVAYAANAAGSMIYAIDFVLESVNA